MSACAQCHGAMDAKPAFDCRNPSHVGPLVIPAAAFGGRRASTAGAHLTEGPSAPSSVAAPTKDRGMSAPPSLTRRRHEWLG
jgi:hypothetical protein